MENVEFEFLRHAWFPIARFSDLGEFPKQVNILGTELIAFQAHGRVTVTDGRCPHRGMSLHLGKFVDGAVECPYHGWLFSAETGECVRVPSLPPTVKPTRASLATYRAEVAYGLVWSSLAEPFLPFPRLSPEVDGTWQIAPGEPNDLRCGMRQLTENFRDRAHFPFVHSGSIGNVKAVVDPYQVTRNGWNLKWTSTVGVDGIPELDAEDFENQLTYVNSLPMCASILVRSPAGGRRLVAQLATPISSDGNLVRQFWLAGIDETLASHGVTLDSVMQFEEQIFKEDHPIVENQYPVEAPLDLHTQVHTAADRFSIVYRRTYAELLQNFQENRGLTLWMPPGIEPELPG